MSTHDIILIILLVVSCGIGFWGMSNLKKAKKLAAQNREICGEEDRVFDFLHNLGESIEKETSASRLQQVIVNGVVAVVGAKGGAIYLTNLNRQVLIPKFVSEHCPQLIGVPLEISKRAQKDPRILESHVRIANQGIDEGLLGACLSSGYPIHVPDVKSHASMRDSFVSYEGDVAAMAAPLRHAGKDLGVLIVAREHSQGLFTDHDFLVFRSIAEQSSFALGNSMIHIEANEKRAFESELRNAREVQRILLPQSDPHIPGYAIAGINISARLISGDYYDFIDLGNHRWGIVIADVSGKGVPAGLLMSMCRSLVRAYAFDETSPTKVLAKVNRQMFPDIREDMFITLTYMILDEISGKLTMSRAGHDAALLFQRETGQITQLRSPGLAIGIDEGPVFERKTVDMEVFLKPGDCLLLHTDGLKEAVNNDDDDYGMDRLKECFLQAATKGAAHILTDMQNSHKDFTGTARQKDDITLVVLEKL